MKKKFTTCHTLKQVKQNATNNLALFFRSAFDALSYGVLCFAHCVAAFKGCAADAKVK